MVVAVQSQDAITAIVPARSSSSRNGSRGEASEEAVLEIKQKTSSRHEKRTKRDYYRYSGDEKQPPIEYVYTYSEETPRPGSDLNAKKKTSTDLVAVNGTTPLGKIECTVGDDGNLVVKIRGKPDSVPLDPDNLPIKLPEGWQLKEIQTNQRSRKTERSRKTRIKDEVLMDEEENQQAVVVYNEHTVAVNGEASQAESSEEPKYGNADEEEYIEGEHNGITYVQKKSRKYEEGPAGLTSKIEESRSEEGIDFDHPNNKQRSSRNLSSLLEKSESAKRKFSKQSVTDEKVTETHTSNVMYFDGNSSSGGAAPPENLRDDRTNATTTTRNQYGRSDVARGRRDNQQEHDILIESPEDTPYNSLDRRDRRHISEDVEIINIDDRYRYHSPTGQQHDARDRVGDANQNYDSSNYSTLSRTEKDLTHTERDLYREDIYGRDEDRREGKNHFEEKKLVENFRQVSPSGGSIFPPTNPNGHSLRDESRSETRNINLTERSDFREDRTLSARQDRNDLLETTERTEITENYRNGAPSSPNGHRKNLFLDNTQRTNAGQNYRYPSQPSQNTLVEKTEKTDIEERYVVQPTSRQRSDSLQTEKVQTHSEHRSTREEGADYRSNPPSERRLRNDGGVRDRVFEKSERTDIVDNCRFEAPLQPTQPSASAQNSSSYSELRRAGRTGDLREASASDFAPPTDTRSPSSTELRQNVKTQKSHQSTGSSSNMVATEIPISGTKSPSPPNSQPPHERKGNKDRVTIDDRYRVIGRTDERPSTNTQHQNSFSSDQQTENLQFGRNHVKTEDTHRHDADALRDSNFSQHVEANEKHRSHSRLTEASSTGERIVPIAISGLPGATDSRRSSRLSSVDLSEIKAGEHLDNRALKDRGNLAQNGSMGQRRPPSRYPAKYHFGEENGPDDVMSNSDTTLPTHFGGTSFRQTSVPRGQSVASSDTGLYVDRNGFDKTRTSNFKQQRTMRDERVLINYVDTSNKPDWVHNIDQHFSGRSGVHNIHYARENVTSPTPRIEEIVTIPGSTVITVNGENEAVHGIVTEPGDRPLLPLAHPVERDVVHQTEKGSKYGFSRLTESKGYKQSAKENVQFQERRENTRQISVSYSIPGKGKETREYTWDGLHEQPQEKITFQEDRQHRKDVSFTLGLDRQPQIPQKTSTERSETSDLQEKFVFEETRKPPTREVSVKLALESDRQRVMTPNQPIESNTFHFEEEVKREREMNFVVGLEQDQQRPQSIHERKESHRSAHHQRQELYDIRTEEVQDVLYQQPVPKVTFHEDRQVTKDVSFTLGLEDYETAEPFEALPVEKITFEETREVVADHDVAVVFGLDAPLPVAVRSPRPVSVRSDSTIRTPDIVPQYSKVREEIKTVETFERIVEEAILETRVVVTPPPPPSPPSAAIIARTEIIPPLPRKVSISAAIESAAIHHNEVDLPQPLDNSRIFETSVDLQAKERHERVEQKLQLEPPPPHPLPPTSGRIEKHVHLEKIVPEPTGEALPESLGTYGFVYTATLEPKKVELEQTIEFQVVEPTKTIEERVQSPLQWYVKEGKAPSEIPDDESMTTVGELRAATPPYHGELTATAQITPPTRVSASAEIVPPSAQKAKPKESARLTTAAEVAPPAKQFYFGEDEDDRLSVHSGCSWEEPPPQSAKVIPPVVEPKPSRPSRVQAKLEVQPPPEQQLNELSRKPGVQADSTHHSELRFTTPEEEEHWKTSLERHALPSRKRTEQSLQLERKEESPRPVPKPSGRIPKKTWSEKIEPEATGKHGAKVMGTYGFLYTATLNPQAVIQGRSLQVEEWQTASAFSLIDLDVQQVLLAAFADIEPRLTPKQQHQLLVASTEIFPPLTEEQQRELLNALVRITPPLTVDQQRQLLTGSDIAPPLTVRQQQQLMTASAEIIPGLTPKQEKQLFYASLQVDPPLTPDQQQQLLFAVSEIFPPAGPKPGRRTIKEIEQMTRTVQEEEGELERLYKYQRKTQETLGRINRRGEWEKTTLENENTESVSTDFEKRRKQYESKDEGWTEEATLDSRSEERHMGQGNYRKDKNVSLPKQRKWLAEQTTYLDEEDQDLEVSAISMNVKPRIKSELLMAPSPPARSLSPYVGGGFQYSASPQMGTPPMTEYSGFMYEAPVDGHGSPMSAEMGTYGFTYHATLDGSEPYRKMAEANMGELEIYTESRRRSDNNDTPKSMSATPPRPSPWSTPPVTPTPVLATATPPPISRGTTPLLPLRELPEPSKESLWKKQGKSSPLNVVSPWGRTYYQTDVVGGKEFSPVEMTFPVETLHRQEVRGDLYSPEEEVHEKITENVIRRRHEKELTYEENALNRIAAESSSWLRRNQDDPFSRLDKQPSSRVETSAEATLNQKNQTEFTATQKNSWSSAHHERTERDPPMEPRPPVRDSSRERSSRDRSREAVDRQTAAVLQRVQQMETEVEENQQSSWASERERIERSSLQGLGDRGPPADARTVRSTSAGVTHRTRDPSVERSSHEAIDRKTSAVVNRVQEMAVLYDTTQQESCTSQVVTQQSHRWHAAPPSNVSRDSETEKKTASVIKRVQEMESEQKMAAAVKRKKDLEAEERAKQEREEVERKTAAVVKRVKEMENEQIEIRRAHEGKLDSDEVRVAPSTPFKCNYPPAEVQSSETTIRKTEHREVHFQDQTAMSVTKDSTDPPKDEKIPDWVRLVEERKRRQEPQQQYFRPDKYAKKEAPRPRQLEVFPEEDPLEAALERMTERKKQPIKASPDSSPSSLRKWGNVGALSSSAVQLPTTSKDDSSFTKGFRRHTTETKEVIEESRFHSEEAMLEAMESGNSNLISTMSQSLPSLAHLKRMENVAFRGMGRGCEDTISMEELRKTSTKVKRTDGAEEETRDVSFARRGDTVSPETKRTKRTVVRKLVNGQWKEVAVREEDIPMDSDILATLEQPAERILASMKNREDDEWSLSDAVIEETTTTRTIRRVEEEEEDIISLAGTES